MSVDQSTMTPTEIRLGVWRNGYNPLALNGKIPASKGWQNTYDLDEDYIRSWATSWPSYTNTGILTKPTPCLDLDVLNPELVEALEEHIHDQSIDRGPILRRVGKAPKLCIPFRSESPFKKIRRDLIAPDGSEQKIEFLADGQQFVAFGIHPETHKPYSWHGHYSPLTVSRDELPLSTRRKLKHWSMNWSKSASSSATGLNAANKKPAATVHRPMTRRCCSIGPITSPT